MIKEENNENASLDALRNCRWWPPFWDAPPYAVLAEGAFECRHVPEEAARNVRKLMNNTSARSDHDPVFTAIAHFQKAVYTILLDARHVSNIDATLEKRKRTCFAAPWRAESVVDWPSIRRILKTMAPFTATSCLKTFLNAWTTSARMGEAVTPSCRFGCSAKMRHMASHSFFDTATDRTAHYVVCPMLWRTFRPLLVDSEWSPLVQCGLVPPNARLLKNVARTFFAFNVIKHGSTSELGLAARLEAARRLSIAAIA